MYGRELTQRETDIIRQLLAERGIIEYEFVQVVNEGRDLPGSTYNWEIELLSAYIVTETAIYMFWLDWVDGKYVLKHWREVTLDKIGSPKFQEKFVRIQQKLQQRKTL